MLSMLPSYMHVLAYIYIYCNLSVVHGMSQIWVLLISRYYHLTLINFFFIGSIYHKVIDSCVHTLYCVRT